MMFYYYGHDELQKEIRYGPRAITMQGAFVLKTSRADPEDSQSQKSEALKLEV